ncbi:MAG: hypothetical protein WC916_01725 [Candidatus Woesearchaeota archaeon]
MFGFFYSLKQYFRISTKELSQVLWTTIAFSLILTAFFKGFLRKPVLLEETLVFFIVVLLFTFISFIIHISAQKAVAIKLGYTATYMYWVNGILVSVFLSFFSLGFIPFILPGSVSMEQVPRLRLGKFRYGMNLKDLARVSLAGPLSHILLLMIAGVVYLSSGKNEIVFTFVIINGFLAVYSCLPIPKIDIPTKMDAGSDGLGIFFFSRTIYMLVFCTILFYVILIALAQVWSLVIAFILGLIMMFIYGATMEQKN